MHLRKADSKLEQLGARVGHTNKPHMCSKFSQLGINSASSKHHLHGSYLPSGAQLRAALNSDLLQRLCDVYLQDFVCFGFEMPGALFVVTVVELPDDAVANAVGLGVGSAAVGCVTHVPLEYL